jgi:hypothetical protein
MGVVGHQIVRTRGESGLKDGVIRGVSGDRLICRHPLSRTTPGARPLSLLVATRPVSGFTSMRRLTAQPPDSHHRMLPSALMKSA